MGEKWALFPDRPRFLPLGPVALSSSLNCSGSLLGGWEPRQAQVFRA